MKFSGTIQVRGKLAAYDLEVFPNYFLAAFKRLGDGKVLKVEAFTENQDTTPARLSNKDIRRVRSLMSNYNTFGFNSNNYDLPIILAALEGRNTSQLFDMSCDTIQNRKRGWQVQKEHQLYDPQIEAKHFDIDEPSPSVMVGLKLYMARLHAPSLIDLPYEFDKWLTREEADKVSAYCGNDLDGTEMLFDDIKQRLDLRESMSKEYGINLMSKSDAQVAEAVIRYDLKKIGIHTKKSKIPSGVRYRPPAYINFKGEELNKMLNFMKGHTFEVAQSTGKPKLPKLPLVKLGGMTYKLGIGGLHSQEKAQVVEPADDELLIDSDVASYYPAIILTSGLAPRSLGKPFLKVYKGIVDRRLAAKELSGELKERIDNGDTSPETKARQEVAETENKSLKITINGSFGKLGSHYSFLYAPDLLLAVTITGQLALLMLIERCVEAGLNVVSANTDGFVTRMKRSQYDLYSLICQRWQDETGFKLEETKYRGLYSRDVNNYLAITVKGEAKGKGVFKKMGVDANPKAPIIAEAVKLYIKDGTPPEETIDACKDVTKFISVQKVAGGAVWRDKYLGRVARWVWVNKGEPIRYKKNGNKVAKSDDAEPLMTLPDKFPVNINYPRYYEEAVDLLKRMGIHYDVL